MGITITPVRSRRELADFIRFPNSLYASDPCWVAPLEFERRQFFNPKKNPFYRHGEAALFLARRDGIPAGRISAQIHHGHLARYKDRTGFFGFFEAKEDPELVCAMLRTAADWLDERGMQRVRGPFNFTMYDNETGILIDGFETPPYLMMNYNPPYYQKLLEDFGFKKAIDLYAWSYGIGEVSEGARQLDAVILANPEVTVRSLNMNRFNEDVALMMRIFNEAWDENYGFIPTTEEEIRHIAKMLKPVIDPEMAFFVFVGGEPAAFSVALPNVNEAIHDLNGRIFPFGWAKLLWRLKRGLRSVRLLLMGIRKPFRGSQRLGAPLSVFMNCEMHRRGTKKGGYTAAELSWTLETNERINRGIEFMGGKKYKTYRVYQKEI